MDYEYDTKTSPMSVFGMFQFYFGDLFEGLNFNSANNIIKITLKNKDGVVQNDKSSIITYEYDSNNMPTKATITKRHTFTRDI